jgi:serine/threonine protein kinase
MIRLYYQEYKEMKSSNCEFYRIGRVLGRGAFGKVNLACHKVCEHLVAIKSIEKKVLRNEKEQKKRVMQEMTILKQSNHPNVVRLYDSFETPRHMCFVMELCQGGDLLSYVRKRRKLKEENAKYLFK